MCAAGPGPLTRHIRGISRTLKGMAFANPFRNPARTHTRQGRVEAGVAAGGQFKAVLRSDDVTALQVRDQDYRRLPETLRMSRFQNPRLVTGLNRCVAAVAGRAATPEDGFARFSALLPRLDRTEAVQFFNEAGRLAVAGRDTTDVLEAAAAEDTRRQPGTDHHGFTLPRVDEDGAGGFTGENFDPTRGPEQLCKDIHAELDAATASNFLPEGVTYSIRAYTTTANGAPERALQVGIHGIADADRADFAASGPDGRLVERQEAVDLRSRVQYLVSSFNSVMVTNGARRPAFYAQAFIESDSQALYREQAGAAQAAGRVRA